MVAPKDSMATSTYRINSNNCREAEKKLRKWLDIPPSFTLISLYSRTSKLQFPFTSLVEEYKVGKTRLVMTLKDSKDEKVRAAGVEVKTGRKWSASKAVTEAECRLRHKDIVGTVAQGRQGALEHQRAATGTRRTLKRDETWYNERSSVQRRKINRQR